jgi:pimeloyl-ACP methyl ester carboxylesterase
LPHFLARIARVGRLGLAFITHAGGTGADAPTHVARDAVLRNEPLFLYDASERGRPARALIFFLGNDIGFWEPHRQLAASLARAQYDVAGFDIRPLLGSLPDCDPDRDSTFARAIHDVIARTQHELGDDSIPIILGGHSLGAELAIWTAAHAAPRGMAGVLALSPGSRSHVRVSVSDVMNGPEPTGPESFSVADAISEVPAPTRIAIVRGTRDSYARADSALLNSGGNRIGRFLVPFAGHSLKRLATASFETRRAIDWLLTGR